MIAFSGHLRLRAQARADGRTQLAHQAFRAPFHLSKPYWDPESRTLLVQVVNPTAGILAGDALDAAVSVGGRAAVLLTTPSASRVFRMREGLATCRQAFAIDAGGWLEFTPEPIVPHRGSRYRQTTTVEVERGARGMFVEQLMPGRVGHGEAWSWTQLELSCDLRVDGRLVLRERLQQSGEQLQALSAVFGASAAACLATIILVDTTPAFAPHPAWRGKVAALHQPECQVGVSALSEGGWTIRLIADGPVRLRDTLARLRAVLADAYPELGASFRRY